MKLNRTASNFYPRSPCGERRVTVLGIQHRVGISIHALLAESDGVNLFRFKRIELFLSTLSLRRATVNGGGLLSCFGNFYPRSPCGERHRVKVYNKEFRAISIHALLAESDMIHLLSCDAKSNFYPRSPCGERLRGQRPNLRGCLFLSTLSLRRATGIRRYLATRQ